MNAPSFGGILRGKRLGFHWSDAYGCFIRISGDGPFLIEVYPGPIPPSKHVDGNTFRAWWESDTQDVHLAMIEDLPTQPTKPATFWVDDDGKTVRR